MELPAPPVYLYKPTWVANTFLARSTEEGVNDIDPLKIQKLVYNLHGWHLATTGLPVVGENFEAWPKGPVLSTLYQKFKNFKWSIIRKYAVDIDPSTGEQAALTIPASDERFHLIFNAVWERYKGYSGTQLSALTHQSETPWSVTRESGLQYIPNDLIKQHFIELSKKTD